MQCKTLYVYWGEGGAKSPRGKQDGLDWFVTDTNPRFQTRGKGNLYRPTVDGRRELTLPADIAFSRTFSVNCYPVLSLCNRLLTVRTKWSRK